MRLRLGYLSFVIYHLSFSPAGAQTGSEGVQMGAYRLADEQQLWRLTQNAAALSLDPECCDSSANRGIAYFDASHRGGDYHRVQEGGNANRLQFYTERYQKIGRYLYGYGSFHFDMGHTKERAWCDVLRPYNSNPYISGSSIAAAYDHQDFTLHAKLASIPLGRFTYGAALSYQVGDLSRLRDPRSRIHLAHYRISPSITYRLSGYDSQSDNSKSVNGKSVNGKSVNGKYLALSFHYARRKEKLPNLTTVQTDPSLAYYVMTGLENATGTVGGYNGYMRQYVDHQLGAELGYGHRTDRLYSVTTIGIDGAREYVYGTNKYEPGTYRHYAYSLATRNRLQAGRLLHSLDLTARYEMGAADEYREERISETDPETGYPSISWQRTMEYKKRYQVRTLDADLHYRLSFTDADGVKGYAGAQYTLQQASNKRLLYTSQLKYASSLVEAEGGLAVLDGRLWIEGRGGYHFSTQSSLSLHDATTPYAVGVLLPDMAYYEANYLRGQMSLTWLQPVTIEGRTNQWFAKLHGDYLKTDNSLSRYTVGLTVGLYY